MSEELPCETSPLTEPFLWEKLLAASDQDGCLRPSSYMPYGLLGSREYMRTISCKFGAILCSGVAFLLKPRVS